MRTSCVGSHTITASIVVAASLGWAAEGTLAELSMNAVLEAVRTKSAVAQASFHSTHSTQVINQAVLPDKGGAFVVACTETAIHATSSRLDYIVAARISIEGTVLESKVGASALPDIAARCEGVSVVGQPQVDEPWPALEIRYRSRHQTEAGEATIDWVTIIDSNLMRVVRRVPVRLGLRSTVARSTLELFEMEPASDASAVLKARRSGRSVVVPCAAECIVDPRAVLDLVTSSGG